jgi:hypothetical protein
LLQLLLLQHVLLLLLLEVPAEVDDRRHLQALHVQVVVGRHGRTLRGLLLLLIGLLLLLWL